MRNSTGDVLHLINLKGDDGKWRNATGEIKEQNNLKVKYYVGQDGYLPASTWSAPTLTVAPPRT